MASVDSPTDLYGRLGYRERGRVVELRTERLPDWRAPAVEILDAAAIAEGTDFHDNAGCAWTGRRNFLQAAAPFLQFTGVRENRRLVLLCYKYPNKLTCLRQG
jgi:hypothetical protein